jgi:Reeler domain
MLGLNTRKKLQAVFLLLTITAVVYAKVTGPEPGYTNAPNDNGSCVACHDTFHSENIGPGSVTITGEGDNGVPIGGIYEPGKQYTLTITVMQQKRQRYGFQMTALNTSNRRAGTLAALNGETQVLSETGFGGRQYIEHMALGTLPNAKNSHVWQVRWTAPDTDIGTVIFYIAGNAADGNGENSNDYIYTNRFFADSVTTHVTLALQTNLDGQALEPGTQTRINWLTTGPDNIDNVEVRYSTDDGATFPITQQVFFTKDASVTGFDWTVPNVRTSTARMRVIVGTKSGSEVTPALSGLFSINGAGAPLPQILSAMVSGKQLLVSGQNFGDGALLFMCDTCTSPATDGSKVKKTFNDELTPATLMVARKAGKSIAPGQTVNLQVKNPDGSVSNTFTFTRPL